MLRNRLFNIVLAAALATAAALTVREAVAAPIIPSPSQATIQCDSLPARSSIRTENNKGTGMGMPRSEDGPTGIDDGLKELLNAYRTCAR